MEAFTMADWVNNEVYQYFGRNPITALDIYKQKNTDLLVEIVVKYMNACPSKFYDRDYRHDWKTQEYVDILKIWIKNNIK